ncbi:MAG TPA: DUF1285 domain-containing protein [Dongiaceae bacterium]|jgi:hypothetical protein
MSDPQSPIGRALNDLGAGPAAAQRGDKNRQQFCGDIDMRIGHDGTWFYHGSPIGRKPLVKLFASVLRREDDGDYWLVTPVERARIRVDDAPFTAVEVNAAGQGRDQRLIFRTNLDDEVVLDAEHPLEVRFPGPPGEPRPYIRVRGRLEARVLRPVFYELVAMAVPPPDGDAGTIGVWSGGQYFSLGRAEN